MKTSELIAATDSEVVAEFLRVTERKNRKVETKLIWRDKSTFLFSLSDVVEEDDKSWTDTWFIHAYVNLNGIWETGIMVASAHKRYPQ